MLMQQLWVVFLILLLFLLLRNQYTDADAGVCQQNQVDVKKQEANLKKEEAAAKKKEATELKKKETTALERQRGLVQV